MEHNSHKPTDSLRDKILGQIKSERIAMRPRLYFTLQLAAVAFVSFLVLIISIFIFNFILFSIRINSHEAFLAFGPRGIVAFLTFFPWVFLIADVLLIVLLEWLLRTFKFGYRLPILYVLGAILLITFATGFVIDRGTPFNDRLMVRAGGPGLPGPLNGMYRDVRRPPHGGVCRCTITAVGNGQLTVEDYRRGSTTTLTVLLPENDPRATSTDLQVGDTVMVAGDREGDVIHAFGVRKMEPGMRIKIIQMDSETK